MTIDERVEWLEADGAGGFASGTASGVRTRRYHALLLTATTPPTGRMVLVNGVDAWATTGAGRFALSSQRYQPDVIHPDGMRHISSFTSEPWPTWEFDIPDGVRIRQEVIVQHGVGATLVVWRLLHGVGPVVLDVRPFMSGRDYHSMHHENGAFDFAPRSTGVRHVWTPYAGVPSIEVVTNAEYRHAPEWYRAFLYAVERERGLDDREDLASPGTFTLTLARPGDEAVMVWRAIESGDAPPRDLDPLVQADIIRGAERARRAAFATPLERAADAYIVSRGEGRSIVAGYPWFTDWGRDTFIAIRGLCLAARRLAAAARIMVQWSSAVSEGMLPNRFPDSGESAEYNSVDASLWFVIAVDDLLAAVRRDASVLRQEERDALQRAVLAIVSGYARGTRYGIRGDADGLLAAGEPGVQLTWMDARVGDRVITPRIGKPVEIQALWLNALWIASKIDRRWRDLFERGRETFARRFWNDATGCLHDVIDVDHVAGTADPTVRPNQLLALGGLPLALLEGDRARSVVDVVERDLLTPLGLRSLAPSEEGYTAHYIGGPSERDSVYHQGTVWPWLLGPFVDAWVSVRGGGAAVQREAHARFVAPLVAKMTLESGGHLCEIADAEAPFTARGCPFQAWSVGELLRLERAYAPRAHDRDVASNDELGEARPDDCAAMSG